VSMTEIRRSDTPSRYLVQVVESITDGPDSLLN
jgi:hypothetical protein